MEIAIYQINLARDKYGVAFKRCIDVEFYINTKDKFDGSIYDKVFHGTVDCKTLDEIYNLFRSPPDNYQGRPIAISDVIEVIGRKGKSKFYYIDYLNYKQIEFSSEKAKTKEGFVETSTNKITVLLVEPYKFPKVIEIENNPKEIQKLIGNEVQVLTPYKDEIAIICNKNKYDTDIPLNRVLYNEPEIIEMSYAKLKSAFCAKHKKKSHNNPFVYHIVFTKDSFKRPYTEWLRTYVISSIQHKENSYSINAYQVGFGGSFKDLGRFMEAECGGEDGWKIERCYSFIDPLATPVSQVSDVIHGSFLVVGCSGNSNEYISLNMNYILKYSNMFYMYHRYLPRSFIRNTLAIGFFTPKPRRFSQES